MKEDKIEQMLRAMEHPEEFTDEELETLFQDQEVRDCYEAALKAEQAFAARRQQPEQQTKVVAMSPRLWFRVAAAFIGVLMLSGISYAAISHLITMDSKPKVAITERKPDVKKVKKTYGIEAAPTKQAPVIYNNVELQQIMQYIADGYGVKVEFKNEATRTLRFYLQWEADDTLQEIIDKINHFEKVHLTLNEDTIFIE